MKKLIKRLATSIANLTLALRGLRLPAYFDDSNRIQMMLHGIETDVVDAAKAYLKPGMLVFDIGANVGLTARAFARAMGNEGKVIAFEPCPDAADYLRHNLRDYPQVEIAECALSDKNETASLHLNPRSGTSNSLIASSAAKDFIDVSCMTLDSFLAEHNLPVPDLIKIDVEGAEPKVLAGMEATLARGGGMRLIIEFCPHNLSNAGYTTRQFYEQLAEYGFSIAILGPRGKANPIKSHDDLIAELGAKPYVNLLCARQ